MVSQIDIERIQRGLLIEAVAKRIVCEHKKYAERMGGDEWAKIAAAKLIDIVWNFPFNNKSDGKLKKKSILNESMVSTWGKIKDQKVTYTTEVMHNE